MTDRLRKREAVIQLHRLWGVAVRVAVLAALACMAALPGCAESTAEVNAPSVWQTKAADPAFARRAEAALRSAPVADPGWRVGVVTAWGEDQYALAALTSEGVVTIAKAWESDGCDSDWDMDQFELTLDPGDLFTWASDARTSHHVCVEDLRVLRKAVA